MTRHTVLYGSFVALALVASAGMAQELSDASQRDQAGHMHHRFDNAAEWASRYIYAVDIEPSMVVHLLARAKDFHFTFRNIRDELSQTGFRPVHSDHFLPEQQFLVFAKK